MVTTRMRARDWTALPVHHVLIAAYPILFLLANNLAEVDPREGLIPTVAAVGVALVLFLILGVVGLSWRRAAVLVSVVAVTFLMYGHVAGALAPTGIPGLALLAGWVAIAVAIGIGVVLVPTDLRGTTAVLNVASGLLVAISLATVVEHVLTDPAVYAGGQRISTVDPSSAPTPDASPGTEAAPLRDIYYLMVEDHGSPRTLREYRNLPDSDFYDWLADEGFTVLEDTRSNYGRTPLSVASSMNMTYLDELAAEMGPDEPSHRPLEQMVADPEAVSFLKARGYSYVLLGSQYNLTDNSDVADVNPLFKQTSDFIAVLTESTILPPVADLLGFEDELSDRRRIYDAAIWGLRTFPQLRDLPGPKFVFMHLFLPHEPWVVDAEGQYVSDEAAKELPLAEQMETQWAFVYREMRSVIAGLLEGPEETRPIIILTTDEGPNPDVMPMIEFDSPGSGCNCDIDWSSATDAHLDEKFSIFAAYYLPGVAETCLYPGMSSVNTFRVVFDLYFDAGMPLLPDRNFIHRNRSHPYDLTDVTDRLPASTAGSETSTTCGG